MGNFLRTVATWLLATDAEGRCLEGVDNDFIIPTAAPGATAWISIQPSCRQIITTARIITAQRKIVKTLRTNMVFSLMCANRGVMRMSEVFRKSSAWTRFTRMIIDDGSKEYLLVKWRRATSLRSRDGILTVLRSQEILWFTKLSNKACWWLIGITPLQVITKE